MWGLSETELRDAYHPIHLDTLPSCLASFFPHLFFPLVYLKCLTQIFLHFYDAPPLLPFICAPHFLFSSSDLWQLRRGLQGPRNGGCENRTVLLMTFNEIHKTCRKLAEKKGWEREMERKKQREGREKERQKKKKRQHHPPPSWQRAGLTFGLS